MSVLRRAVSAFDFCDAVSEIVVVARADEMDFVKSEISDLKKVKHIVSGGETRAESAKIGFSVAESTADYVAIHDGARCFVTDEMIKAVFADAKKYGAATASSRVFDTVKTIDDDGFINSTLNRDTVRHAQTPQIFKTELYRRAVDFADSHDAVITDDNMLLESIGAKVFCTDTGGKNIKITTKSDLEYAECLLNGD